LVTQEKKIERYVVEIRLGLWILVDISTLQFTSNIIIIITTTTIGLKETVCVTNSVFFRFGIVSNREDKVMGPWLLNYSVNCSICNLIFFDKEPFITRSIKYYIQPLQAKMHIAVYESNIQEKASI
jgi:hypothetical protein